METEKPSRKRFAFMASPEDLNSLREMFGEMACSDDERTAEFARRIMAAVHRCRRKHGFKWVH